MVWAGGNYRIFSEDYFLYFLFLNSKILIVLLKNYITFYKITKNR